MEVICIKDSGTNKLIKGQKYNAIHLYESWTRYIPKGTPPPNGMKRRKVMIDGINSYFVDRFIPVNGVSSNDFYNIPLFDYRDKEKNIDKNKCYIGQYVKCGRWERGKWLKSGQIYYVEDDVSPTSYHSYHTKKFKLKGIKNLVQAYGFVEVPVAEQRKLKLQNISGHDISTGVDKRKFLHFSKIEQKRIIFELLFSSIKNLEKIENLNGISVIDMMLKVGSKYNIIKEDIEPVLDNKISDILKDINLL